MQQQRPGLPYTMYVDDRITYRNYYDDLGRKVHYDIYPNGYTICPVWIEYDTNAENGTTNLLPMSYMSSDFWRYTYDSCGNITRIQARDEGDTRYEYDELNQLIREDNGVLGKTICYTYNIYFVCFILRRRLYTYALAGIKGIA